MEPSSNTPERSPGSTPNALPKPEQSPLTPDTSLEQGPKEEALKPATESSVRAAPVMPATTLPKPVAPPPPLPPQDKTATDATAVTDNSPPIADDADLIEKEWVDKAKKIVDDNKDNPHQQEKAVSELQADYLQKRYGKVVKTDQ